MGTSVVGTKPLEERVTERLHVIMGELITDADLKPIVERGIEKFLFEPRVVESKGYYGTEKQTKPSLVQEVVDKYLLQQMTAQVDQWLKDHPEQIQTAIDDAIRRGMAHAVTRTLDERFESIFGFAIETMKNRGLLPR